jgi:endo-1,4-beta-xylanase
MKTLPFPSVVAGIFLLVFCLYSCGSPSSNSTKTETAEIKSRPDEGLKDWASFPVGGAVNTRQLLRDKKLQSICLKNFNSLTATNDMKMYTFLKEEGQYHWEAADSLVAFCERHGLRVFGHTLVWHFGAPGWITENADAKGPEWVDSFLKEYIRTVVGRYKGQVAAWDVVNEALATQGRGYRESFWYKTLGPSYIEKAFRYANETDPDALLFYNDFNIERDTAKLHTALEMIRDLQAKKVPLHGLGFQMHLRMDVPDEIIAYSLKKAAETGLKIHISELDIIFNRHDDSQKGGEQVYTELTEEMKQAQAQKYKSLVKMYRSLIPAEQQYGITFWDFTDRDTWIRPFFNITDWPTVFDENLEPKPAYYGFKEGLTEEL